MFQQINFIIKYIIKYLYKLISRLVVNKRYIYKLFTLLNDSGSIDSEDVRRKFVSQKETKDRLTTLKTNTENQKKDLQIKCQQLNEEFEQCRFSDAQDKEQ